MQGGENSGPEPRGRRKLSVGRASSQSQGSTFHRKFSRRKVSLRRPSSPKNLSSGTLRPPRGLSSLSSQIYFLNSTEQLVLCCQILLHNSVFHESPQLVLPLFLLLVAQTCSTYFIPPYSLVGCLYVCFTHSPGNCLRVGTLSYSSLFPHIQPRCFNMLKQIS